MRGRAAPDRLVVFARHPAAGQVNRGLTPPLPPDAAARVYEACLHDVLHSAARERGRIELWYDARPGAEKYFAEWFPHLRRRAVTGGSDGEKLERVFDACFGDGARRAIAVAGGTPTLPPGVLTAAFNALREAELVVGPARRGGHYLLGMAAGAWPGARHVVRRMGRDGGGVRDLLGAARRAGLQGRLLPGWYDIHRTEDLVRARRDAPPDSNLGRWLAGPAGRRYIGA